MKRYGYKAKHIGYENPLTNETTMFYDEPWKESRLRFWTEKGMMRWLTNRDAQTRAQARTTAIDRVYGDASQAGPILLWQYDVIDHWTRWWKPWTYEIRDHKSDYMLPELGWKDSEEYFWSPSDAAKAARARKAWHATEFPNLHQLDIRVVKR